MIRADVDDGSLPAAALERADALPLGMPPPPPPVPVLEPPPTSACVLSFFFLAIVCALLQSLSVSAGNRVAQ